MTSALPLLYLARHGETAWSVSGQHTGLTDLPLTERGERNAQRLGQRLQGIRVAQVFSSPLLRARRTAELAGFGAQAIIEPDLVEWNYGDYEGKKTAEIRQIRPGWQLFRDGCPNGESVASIGARAGRLIARLRALEGDTLIFSSGHILRVLAARWCGLDASAGRLLYLGTAALCILGYDHDRNEPAIRIWNENSYLAE
jgi:probable phosphoglycerate mutase